MDKARSMHRENWDERFTAHAVINYMRTGFDMPPLPQRPRRILYEIDPDTGVCLGVNKWTTYDFGGLESDGEVLYGISTRHHGLDARSVLYSLSSPSFEPVEIGEIAAREMEGIAVYDGELLVMSGEDKAIHRYDIVSGSLLGTIPTPVSFWELGATFGGASILELPWP
jgi:hypothetical protein